jgi:hypothetical protein
VFDLKSDRAAAWTARGLIVAMAIVFGWYTWGHWGDLQIDSGREMYVPVEILRGKLLFRDIWYQYGPLTPYIQAFAFTLFGPKLNVLYVTGLVLVISSALLLFEIGRNFELKPLAAMAPALFLLAESYHPSIFNFIFPYSYAASMGACFGLACLLFTVRYAIAGQLRWLVLAAFCTSLALLTKQEFGITCLVVLGFETLAPCCAQRSWHKLAIKGYICAAGLLPTFIVYGFFVWKLSAKSIFFDNWVMTPGTYTMTNLSHHKMALDGFRFEPTEWLAAAFGAMVSLTLWFGIGYANALAITKLRLDRCLSCGLIVIGDIVVVFVGLSVAAPVWPCLPPVIGQIVFPKGMYLIALMFAALAILTVWRTRAGTEALAEAALGIYAVLAGVRVMMEMRPKGGYEVFFNGSAFLVFAIVVARIIARGAGFLDRPRRDLLIGCMLSAEVLLLIVGFFPKPGKLPAPLKTEFGTIYTQTDRAVLFTQIISFMKTHTRNGKDILVLPESASLYYFSGMQAPNQWYEVPPGVLDPKQELAFINEAESAHVQYVLLDHRRVDEFGIAPFGIGYDQSIYKWIMVHYVKVGQFGPRPDLLPAGLGVHGYQPYVMEVYERNNVK